MSTLHVLAGIAWDPQIRGFLALGVGVVVLIGSVYLLLATNVGARLGFLIAADRLLGLAVRSWASSGGSTAPWACSATCPRGRSTEVVVPGDSADAGARRGPRRSTPSEPARRRRSSTTLEGADLDEACGRRRSSRRLGRLEAAARVRTRATARPRPPSTSTSSSDPTTDLGVDSADDYIADVLLRAGRQGRSCRRRPEPIDRITHKLKTDLRRAQAPAALRHRPGAAGRSSRRPCPARPPPLPEADESAARRLGDHGARPRRRAASPAPCSRIVVRDHVRRCCQRAPPPRQARRRGPRPAARDHGGLTRWASTSRSSSCWSWPSSSPRSAWWRRSCWPRSAPRRPSRRPTSAASCPAGSRPSASRCASTWSR